MPDRSEPPFSYPYEPEDGREQSQAPDDISRVGRGGAFWYAPRNARCAYRVAFDARDVFSYLGYRVVVRPCL